MWHSIKNVESHVVRMIQNVHLKSTDRICAIWILTADTIPENKWSIRGFVNFSRRMSVMLNEVARRQMRNRIFGTRHSNVRINTKLQRLLKATTQISSKTELLFAKLKEAIERQQD